MFPDDQGQHQPSDQPDESTSPASRPEVVATTDPGVSAARSADQPRPARPEETTVAETTPGRDSSRTAPPSAEGDPKGQDHGARDAPKRDHHPGPGRPAEPPRSGWMRYAITGAVALACGVGGAWGYSRFASDQDKKSSSGDASKQAKKGGDEGSSKRGPGDAQAKGGEDAPAGGGPTEAKDAPPGSLGNLSDQVKNLSGRFETLRQRIEMISMPKDTNPPDLAALRIRMDEFARNVDDLKALMARSREMDERLTRLQDQMKGMAGRPGGSVDPPAADPGRLAPATSDLKAEAPVDPPPPVKPGATDEALEAGIALFKKEKYPQAMAAFRSLQQSKSQDARVWYYSALANGFATGQWDGETRSFVMQGAERERAGLPAASVIDAAFSDLLPGSGKNWLDSYRSQLVKR